MMVYKVDVVNFWYGGFGDVFESTHATELFLNKDDAEEYKTKAENYYGFEEYKYSICEVVIHKSFRNDFFY